MASPGTCWGKVRGHGSLAMPPPSNPPMPSVRSLMASERGKAGFMSEWTSAEEKCKDCEGKIGYR